MESITLTSTNMTTVPSESTPRHIFDLAPELRLHVYANTISDFDYMAAAVPESGKYYLPLLDTCQTIRNEALRPWLKHLRSRHDEAQVKYKEADQKAKEYFQYYRSNSNNDNFDVYWKLLQASLYVRAQHLKLRDMFFADSNTALDHANAAPPMAEGVVELLEWVKLNFISKQIVAKKSQLIRLSD